MSEFKIEKGEAPATSRVSWPFGGMDVGDTFLVPLGHEGVSKAVGAAHAYGKSNGKKFTCRSQADGVRIWRTK